MELGLHCPLERQTAYSGLVGALRMAGFDEIALSSGVVETGELHVNSQQGRSIVSYHVPQTCVLNGNGVR